MTIPKYQQLRSTFEELLRLDLEHRGIIYGYESIKLKYTDKYCPHCKRGIKTRTYTPDFILNGRVPVVVEAKGNLTVRDRTKLIAVKRAHPDLDLRLVFQRDNLIRKGSTTRYTEWSKQHGFPCAVGLIPESWIPEG